MSRTRYIAPQSTLESYMLIQTDIKFKYRYFIVLCYNNETNHSFCLS